MGHTFSHISRHKEAKRMGIEDRRATAVDLFCGAGGLSLGLSRAGFDVVEAHDCWKPAVATYRANLGDHVFRTEINADLSLPDATLFCGGPPCQGFSSAGRRKSNDARNSLVSIYGDLIAQYRPKAFIFENVEGFLTGARGRFVFEFLDRVIDAGYRVHLRKVNAAHFGVPQHRKRVIAIGGLGWDPSYPEHTHAAVGAPGVQRGNVRTAIPTPTISEALCELPKASDGKTDDVDEDHTYRPLKGDDLRRAEALKQGQRMRDLPEELWHESYRKRAFRRVKDGTPTEKRGGAPSGIRRLSADEPSKAITGGALRDFLHPTEDRMLTLRECAVLQTFPASFVFHGSKADRIQLIGNAVPPRLGEMLGRSLLYDLSELEVGDEKPGALLSFIPTLADGMSPILDEVTKRVRKSYPQSETQLLQGMLWD
jgi:DNA (cytosine-5)-methyltransferase 1